MKLSVIFTLFALIAMISVVNAATACEKGCNANLAAKKPSTCPTKQWNACHACCMGSCCVQGRGSSGCKTPKCTL